MFNPEHKSGTTAPEATFEGRVEILGDFPKGKFGKDRGAKHSGLLLQTDQGRIVIHLGPAAYFLRHNFQIKAGDRLKVKGVQVLQGPVPLVQASEVKSRNRKLKLRDQNGLHLWPAVLDRLH
uniref:Magnetosome protein MamS/MamX domain-containing protein n=1 Tax=Desulfobacca acetoxidans TaxID=60893 RepID=A0A7C3V9V2_9BACT